LRFLIGCKTLINGSFAFGLIGCTLIKPYGLEPFQFQLSLGHLPKRNIYVILLEATLDVYIRDELYR